MELFLVGVASTLIAAIFFLLFRFIVPLKKAKNIDLGSRIQKLSPWLLLVCFGSGLIMALTYIWCASDDFLPESASEHGVKVDFLFSITLCITGFTFIATQGLLFYFSFKYRSGNSRIPLYYTTNNKLEIFWTIVPFIVFAMLFVLGEVAWKQIKSPETNNGMVIEIMAEQFNWRIRYPGDDGKLGRYHFKLIDATNDFGMDFSDPASGDDIAPLQLHIPKGIPVKFMIRSRDVIHSVFIPYFRLKMDAVPGMPTSFLFTAKYTTDEMREKLHKSDFNYEMACAELCGRMHFAMLMLVIVDTPEDYNKWYKEQKSWLSAHYQYKPLTMKEITKQAGESLPLSSKIEK